MTYKLELIIASIALIFILSLSGCATTSAILQGMGQGLQQSSRSYSPPRTTYCNTNVVGSYANTDCTSY